MKMKWGCYGCKLRKLGWALPKAFGNFKPSTGWTHPKPFDPKLLKRLSAATLRSGNATFRVVHYFSSFFTALSEIFSESLPEDQQKLDRLFTIEDTLIEAGDLSPPFRIYRCVA